jgi:hypothetical protein
MTLPVAGTNDLYTQGLVDAINGKPERNVSHQTGRYFGAVAVAALTQYLLRYQRIWLPKGLSVVGLGYLVATTSNGNVKVFIAPMTTRIIARSSNSTGQGTINQNQKVPFTSAYAVPDDGMYLIGIISDSATGSAYMANNLDPDTTTANGNFTLPTGALTDPGTDLAAAGALTTAPVMWTY